MRTCCAVQGTLLGAVWQPKWEGNPKKRGYIIYVADSLCHTAETNTTFWSNYAPIKKIYLKNFSLGI